MSEKLKAVAVAMAIAGMDVCNVDSDISDNDNDSERRTVVGALTTLLSGSLRLLTTTNFNDIFASVV